MGNATINALIAAGIIGAIGYGWLSRLQNRSRRSRAGASGDGDSYSESSDGFSPASWFSSDASGNATDGGSCVGSDSSGGGDCGGDGGGGGD